MKAFFRLLAAACMTAVFLAGCGRTGGSRGASSASSAASSAAGTTPQAASSEAASSAPVTLTDKIPVLMYHSLEYDPSNPNNSARIKAEDFAAQMKWLHDNGYTAISLDTLYQGLAGGKGFPEKSVVLTFDDGYGDFYTNGFPVLVQYGFAATVFMISSYVDKAGYLTSDQLKTIAAGGVTVEDHTVTHPYLDKLSYDSQYKELGSSRTALEGITGVPITAVAYPYGHFDSETIRATRALSYHMGFKMSGGWVAVGDDMLEIPRVYIGDSLDSFITKVTKVQ